MQTLLARCYAVACALIANLFVMIMSERARLREQFDVELTLVPARVAEHSDLIRTLKHMPTSLVLKYLITPSRVNYRGLGRLSGSFIILWQSDGPTAS